MSYLYPSIPEREEYYRTVAQKYNIDPDIAVKVAGSEGMMPGVWQSNVYKNGRREKSYGDWQMRFRDVGPGLGDEFFRQTGLDPSDQKNWKEVGDFALKTAAQKQSWGDWYGAGRVGIGKKQGFNAPMNLGPSEKPMQVNQPQFPPLDPNNAIDPKRLTPLQLAMLQAEGYGGPMGPGSTPGLQSNPMQLALGQGDPSMFGPMAAPGNAPMNANQSVPGGGVTTPLQQAMQVGPNGPMDMAQDGPGGYSDEDALLELLKGKEKDYSFGSKAYIRRGLLGTGAALSSIDNPQGGAVALGLLKQMEGDDDDLLKWAKFQHTANRDPVGEFKKKHAYKDALKAAEEWTGAAKKADEDLLKIQNLKGLLSNIDEQNLGPVGEAKLMVDQLAVQLGMDPANFKDMDARAAFASLVKQRALSERNPAGGAGMPGNFSDQDRKYLDKIAGGLFLNKASNELILDLSETMFKRQAEAAREADRYLRSNGTAEGLIEHMDEWRNQRSVFTDRPDYFDDAKPKTFKAEDYFN